MIKITEQRKPLGSAIKGTHAEAVYSDGSGSLGFWSGGVSTEKIIDLMWGSSYNPAPANLSLVSVTIVEI